MEEDKDDYAPALGQEVDVSKGVGRMLKLAGQKGYLQNPNAKSHSGPSLDHLKNKTTQRIDGQRLLVFICEFKIRNFKINFFQ